MSFNYSPKIVTDGLIFYVDAANPKSYLGTGTDWFDLTPNSNDGVLTNGPTFDSANGGSIVFDGADDYVSHGDVLNFERTDSFSIDVWTKLDSISTTQILVAKWINKGYEIFFLNPGKIGWTLANTGGGVNQIRVDSSNNAVSVGEIFNLCVTYDGSSSTSGMKIYKNGSLLSTSSIYNNLNSSISLVGEFRLGANSSGSPLPLNGNIFNTKIYNKELMDDEVFQNYNALKTRFGL